MIWGKWKSAKVAMGYMAKSQLTKLENAAFLDLNRNKLSKQVLKPMELNQDQDEENMEPTTKGRKRSERCCSYNFYFFSR